MVDRRSAAESSGTTWADEELGGFVMVEATGSGSAECSGESGSEAAPRPRSLALPAAAPAAHAPHSPHPQPQPPQPAPPHHDTTALQFRVSFFFYWS